MQTFNLEMLNSILQRLHQRVQQSHLNQDQTQQHRALEDFIAASSFLPVVLLVFQLFYFFYAAMTAKGEQCADLPE